MNRRTFGAGLGLILFGMDAFEESIKRLGGPKLRELLQRYTKKGWMAVSVSALITAVLNSSTLVSLLTLGFVGAGMMPLLNAVGVIVGANIGSTATGLIVALLGTSELNIGIIALPMITLGAVIFIITQSKYRSYWAKLLIGFGLFFLGISMFKENIDVMKTTFDLSQYADMSLWIFGFIGMVVTAIVHSSGAVGVMTLAALSSGIIGFEAGFAIILGANIGTTFSSFIVGLHGSTAKKQIGIANILFNIITVIIGIILFHPYIWFTLDVLGYRDDLVMGNAMINLVFNLTTSLAFIPFLGQFTRLITRIIPSKGEEFPLQIIKYTLLDDEQKYDSDLAHIIIEALENDRKYITKQTLEYISTIWNIDTHRIEKNEPRPSIVDNLVKFDNEIHKTLYKSIKNQLDIILTYIPKISHMDLDADDRVHFDNLLRAFIGLSNACKSIESIRENILTIKNALDPNVRILYYELLDIIIDLNKTVYNKINNLHLKESKDINQVIGTMTEYRNNILSHVGPFIINGNVGDMDASSLVNMTGELVDCMKSIQRAIR